MTPNQVKDVTGDKEPTGDLSVEGLAKALMEKWEVFILLIDNYSAEIQHSKAFYTKLFGSKRVLVLENDETVAETVAVTIGAMEGVTDVDDALLDLSNEGSSNNVLESLSKTMAGFAGGTLVASGNGSFSRTNSSASRL